MEDKNYIYKKLSDGRYIKEIDNKTEHLATAEEDAKLATDIRSLLQGEQGQSGTSGTSGESGTSGIDGQKGDIGRTGLTGPRGQNGTSGSSGSSGQDGTSGVDGQNGTSGINGRKGDKGDKGDRGFPGLQGPSGRDGSTGVSGTSGTSAPGITSGTSGTSGAVGTSGTSGVNGQNGQSSSYFLYKAKANTYTGNPDHGYILWNNATQTGATAIHINHLTQGSIDIDIFLGLIRQGSNLIIQHQTNSGEYQTWDVTATPTLVSGANNYWIVPVTLVNSTISFGNNDDIFVAISADSGTSGSSGTSGVNGTSGVSGSNILSSLFFSGNIIAPIVMNATSISNVSAGLNNTFLSPFVFARQTVVTSFSFEMGSQTANNARIYIYSDSGGKPLNKLVESTNLSTNSTGYKTYTSTFTFSAGVTYWQGIQCDSSTPGFRGAAVGATVPIGYPPTAGNAIYNSYAYSTTPFNLPSSLTQSSLALRTGVMPIVFMTLQ